MADVLRLIDAAIGQAGEVLFCGWCKEPLTGHEPTLEFCSQKCQQCWFASPRWSYGQMPESGLTDAVCTPDNMPVADDFDVRYVEGSPPSRWEVMSNLQKWKRLREQSTDMRVVRCADAAIERLRALLATLTWLAEVPVSEDSHTKGRYHAQVTVVPGDYDNSDDVWLTEREVLNATAAAPVPSWLTSWWRDRIRRHSQ